MAKILIVDDDPDFVETTRIVLEGNGYEVITASSGEEALRVARETSPDLIILDVIMSTVLDGVNATRQLREQYNHIPIIMVTSIANTDYAALFPTDEYIPIDLFLTKPILPDRLLTEVRRLLKHS